VLRPQNARYVKSWRNEKCPAADKAADYQLEASVRNRSTGKWCRLGDSNT